MNKKQIIIAWLIGILIILNCMYPPLLEKITNAPINSRKLITNIISLFIIGGILIYTLRDKNRARK